MHAAVSPKISESGSSDVVTSREWDTVALTCNASGVPEPEITWYRRTVEAKTVSLDKESESLKKVCAIEIKERWQVIHPRADYCEGSGACFTNFPKSILKFLPKLTFKNLKYSR